MVNRASIWIAILCLMPVYCRAGQAVAGSSSEQRDVAPGADGPAAAAEKQVDAITGMHRSSLTTNSAMGTTFFVSTDVSNGYDTNPPLTFGLSMGDVFTRISGRFALRRSRATGETDLSYSGGGMLYRRRDSFDRSFHRAGLTKTFITPRWNLLAADHFEYLPDAPFFEYGSSTSGTGFQPGLSPNDAVLVGDNEPRYSNRAALEVTHTLSARSSLTAGASYGLLRFLNVGLLGNSTYNYSGGLNHMVTRRDTLGVRYTDKRFVFQTSDATVVSHSPAFVLEHRVENRILAHVEAGPELYVISEAPNRSLTHWTWAAEAGFEFAAHKSTFASSYSHGASDGSGVMVGSELHAAMGRVEQRLSSQWSAAVEGSWSRSESITPGPAALSNLTVFMGTAGIERRVTPFASVYLRYAYANESRPQTCAELSCVAGLNRQMAEVGFKIARSSGRLAQREGR